MQLWYARIRRSWDRIFAFDILKSSPDGIDMANDRR